MSDLAATSQGSLLLLNVGFQDVDGAPPRNAAKQDSDQRRLSSSVWWALGPADGQGSAGRNLSWSTRFCILRRSDRQRK